MLIASADSGDLQNFAIATLQLQLPCVLPMIVRPEVLHTLTAGKLSVTENFPAGCIF